MRVHPCVSVLLCALFLSLAEAEEKEPLALIPPLSVPVKLDGTVTPEEWRDAATLRRVFRQDNRIPGNPPTEFKVKYASDALYVAAIGMEPDCALPEAKSRAWDDLLFRMDDTFSVVLGLRDSNVSVQQDINMGGYEGAMGGKSARADFYYTFTANAAGSKQRLFNEMPLEKALFEASVARGEKSWSVEFRIPFNSFGARAVAGCEIYANLFRWRPPEVQAWHHKRFRGYAAMPFGKFRLLSASEAERRTREKLPPPPGGAAKSCRAELQYNPLLGAVIGKTRILGKWNDLTGILRVDGFPEIRQKLVVRNELTRDAIIHPDGEKIACVIQKLTPGSQPARKAHFTVVDAAGKTVSKTELECQAVKAPEWFQQNIASEYLNNKCPTPWSEPKLDKKRVSLRHATFEFNDFALPCGAQIEVTIDGTPLRFSGRSELKKAGTDLRGEAVLRAENIRLEVKSRMEFDGFTEVKFRFPGIDPHRVDGIRLRIPFSAAAAKLLLPGQLVQNAAALPVCGYNGPGEQFWLGDHERGIAFAFDTKVFFGRNQRHQIEVVPGKKTTELGFRFVDGPGQFDAETVFRFFLLPTPTKPRPERPIRALTERQWETWGGWHGYPDTGKISELKKWTKKLSAENKVGILYTCQGLREDAPFLKEFQSDFELQPRWRYYRHRSKNCFATNKRGPEGEMQLFYWKKLIQEAGVRGIISDGMSPAWGDVNPAMAKIDATDLQGRWEDMSSRIVAQRNFLKRFRGMFSDTGEPFGMLAHTGGGLDAATLSFFDGYMEGEQMTRFKPGYFLPEAVYAVGYSGMPWGWRSVYWSKHWRNYLAQESQLAYSLLFNTEFNGNFQAENPSWDLELTRDFEMGKGEFHPFWHGGDSRVAFDSDRAKMSFYTAQGKALIVVSNLTSEAASYTLDFTKLFPGDAFHARELLDNRQIKEKQVSGRLVPHSCDIIRIDIGDAMKTQRPSKQSAKTVVPFNITSTDLRDWKVNSERKNVAFHVENGNFHLQSTPGPAAAMAEFQHPFGRDFSMDLEIGIVERFRFELGPVTVGYGNGWVGYGWFVKGPVAKRGFGHVYYQVPLAKRKKVPLRISLRNGELNVVYNNMPVVRGLKVELPASENYFRLATWHTDSLDFTVRRATDKGGEIIHSSV
ncbi:MAG: DUF6067 family protein, partial [Victivallaceae bacterium]|nr:DUF6067 family protein [Victivallaceae bacterium]